MDTVHTFAGLSAGVLWDGVGEERDDLEYTPVDKIYYGTGIPNVVDMQLLSLSKKLTEIQCLEYIQSLNLLEDKQLEQFDKEQLELKLAKTMAVIIKQIKHDAGGGGWQTYISFCNTIVHGRQHLYNMEKLQIFFVDVFCEKYDFDVVEFCHQTMIDIFTELGYFIQNLGVSGMMNHDGSFSHMDRDLRLSWYKPDISRNMELISHISQIETFKQGISLNDICA